MSFVPVLSFFFTSQLWCNTDATFRFKEKLEKGMTNFFRRVQPQSPVLRNNYFIQVDDKLAWSESIGSEDATEGVGWFTAEKNKAIEHHYFRSERQSLRR